VRRSTQHRKRDSRKSGTINGNNNSDQQQVTDTVAQAKSAFIANISHEIRTPMNAIMGFAQMLKSSRLNEQQLDYVDVIIDSGKKLLLIISNLLDISNLQLGKTGLNPRLCHLVVLTEKLWLHFRPLILAKKLKPILECSADIPEVVIDSEKLERVVGYIISNAIKYTNHGHVTFRVSYKPSNEKSAIICMEISDSGIGIPEDRLPHIFEVFEQVDNSITRPYSGMGIGLGLSYQIVNLLGGKIKVLSTVGEGSRFILEMPAPLASANRHK